MPLPAVFLQQQGDTRVCVDARSLHDCQSMDDLKNLIDVACRQALE